MQSGDADILEVISDLSTDEVRTPPSLARAVLETLPNEVWTDSSLRWLEPASKTGVFLREAAKKLMVGLSDEFPDEQVRLEHILKNMLFGIGITELTAMMSRRTVYCSKTADGPHSVVQFQNSSGNIWHERVEHNFEGARCRECNAPVDKYDHSGTDNYAYAFIHEAGRETLEQDMGLKFDVVVGNPPYQMEGGGGGSNATPLYNLFVEQAKALNPRYISMIIQSRWMAGGRGLDQFRSEMLSDERIRKLVDFPIASDIFPAGIDITGGVCYFLWNRDDPGPCEVTLVRGEESYGPVSRDLDEFDVFIRDSRALSILHKVKNLGETTMDTLVSGDTPYGLASNFKGYSLREPKAAELKLFINVGNKRVDAAVPRTAITKNRFMIDVWKVLIPKARGGDTIPDQVLGVPIVAPPGSVCTQTYLTIGPLETQVQAENLSEYIGTRFFRFLVSLRKISQDAMRSTYSWVPVQDFNSKWTDEELFKKYDITQQEIEFIEKMIREMP